MGGSLGLERKPMLTAPSAFIPGCEQAACRPDADMLDYLLSQGQIDPLTVPRWLRSTDTESCTLVQTWCPPADPQHMWAPGPGPLPRM